MVRSVTILRDGMYGVLFITILRSSMPARSQQLVQSGRPPPCQSVLNRAMASTGFVATFSPCSARSLRSNASNVGLYVPSVVGKRKRAYVSKAPELYACRKLYAATCSVFDCVVVSGVVETSGQRITLALKSEVAVMAVNFV